MRFISIKAFIRSRYPLAIAGGALLGCAFPNIGIAGFAWIAPGFLLAVALGVSTKQCFRLGYVAGMVHYLVSLSWLLRIPVAGFPILGWVALSAFLALYPATWVWLASRISPHRLTGASSMRGGGEANTINSGWRQRAAWAISCAALWVALEMIISRFLGGFPWNLLGASQYRMVPMIQFASVTGIYGVSFLVVWASVSLLNASLTILRRPGPRSLWTGEIILPMLAVGIAFAFGFHRLQNPPAPATELKIALVQPSIPQTLIWNQDNDAARFHDLLDLSEQALTNHPDVLIWPEAAVPGFARWDTNIYPAITNLAFSQHVWMVIGSDDVALREHPTDSDRYEYFNASFLINPDGEFIAHYHKRKLVIFGEYIPFEHSLPFVKWLTPITGSYTPGERSVPFDMNWPTKQLRIENLADRNGTAEELPLKSANTSVMICFEDTFPQLARGDVHSNTDFLVNITNDGWFGRGAAQWQQAACAVFRAVENGVPLVRCANTGVTCWIDSFGRIRQVFTDKEGTIYGPGFLTIEMPLLAPEQKPPPTFYNQHGDWFGWSCVGLALIVVLLSRRRLKT